MDLVYIIGPPAAGKSTLMRALTSGCQRYEVKNTTVPHQRLIDPRTAGIVAIELGRMREKFPGTDTLAMNIAPAAKLFMIQMSRPDVTPVASLILGEGDRLGFLGFFEAALGAGVNVTLVHLTCEGETLDSRCEERGSAQNEVWRRGRATKALRTAELAAAHGAKVVRLDSTGTRPSALAEMLRAEVPCLSVLPAAFWCAKCRAYKPLSEMRRHD